MTRASLASLPLLLVVLAGCAAAPLSAEDVATKAEDALEQRSGVRPEITCPEDLAAEVGASARCSLVLDGVDGTYGVTVTVTSVEDGEAHFDVRVDDEPRG